MYNLSSNNSVNKINYAETDIKKTEKKTVQNKNVVREEQTPVDNKKIAEGYRGVLAGILYKSPSLQSFSGNKNASAELVLSVDEKKKLSTLLKNKNAISLINLGKLDADTLHLWAEELNNEEIESLSVLFENTTIGEFTEEGTITVDNVYNWVKNNKHNLDRNIPTILQLFSGTDKENEYYYPILIDLLNSDAYLSSSYTYNFPVLDEEQYLKYQTLKEKGTMPEQAIPIAKARNHKVYQNCLELIELGIDGESALEIAKSDKDTIEKCKELFLDGVNCEDLSFVAKLDDIHRDRYRKLIKLGVDRIDIENYIKNDEDYTDLMELLKRGIRIQSACNAIWLKESDKKDGEGTRFKKFNEYIDMNIDAYCAIELAKLDDGIELDRNIYLAQRGIDNVVPFMIEEYTIPVGNDIVYNRVIYILENGFSIDKAIEVSNNDEEYNKLKKKIEAKHIPIRDFLNSEDYQTKIDKICKQSQYPQLLSVLLNRKTMYFETLNTLLNSGLSEKDFIQQISKFQKTYNMAMKTPNAFLSNIDISYTTTGNGKFPKLDEGTLKTQQKAMNKFFSRNLGEILRLLKYTDRDTINQLMNRRTNLFGESLKELNEISDENLEVVSKLIKCKKSDEPNKELSAKEKVDICRIIRAYQIANIDINDNENIKSMIDSNKVDIKLLKDAIQIKLMEKAGISNEEAQILINNENSFNQEYAYLLLMNYLPEIIATSEQKALENMSKSEIETKYYTTRSILNNVLNSDIESVKQTIEPLKKILKLYESILAGEDKYSDEDVFNIFKDYYEKISSYISESDNTNILIRETARGTFSDYILDPNNIYGKSNAETKTQFEQQGINFDKWINPSIDKKDSEFEVSNEKLKIKLWDRNPQEDIFLGNKTSCCTAMGIGTNGNATPIYLLNQAFNVVTLCNENGDVLGMSRIYMGEIEGKPSLLMDNIELNANFIKNKDNNLIKEIRNAIFHYMNKYAQQLGNEIPVYFSTSYAHVPTGDLDTISSKTKFIGKISDELVYINAYMIWINPSEMDKQQEVEWYAVDKNV